VRTGYWLVTMSTLAHVVVLIVARPRLG